MRKDKVRAYELRREGKSYSEIGRLLAISKSTLAGWFKGQDWSKEIRDSLYEKYSLSSPRNLAAAVKATRTHWAKLHQTYRDAGKIQFEKLKKDSLFLAGVMLYWGEGDKGQKLSRIKLANTDPMMIRLFYSFLKDALKIPPQKINVWLLLYPDLIDNMQKNFWSKATGIPLAQFKNSIYIQGKHPTKRLSYGVCNIYINSRELKEKMLVWLDLYPKILIR